MWRRSLLRALQLQVMVGMPHVLTALCPKGFGGGEGFFPEEWQIPNWPADLPMEAAAKLRIVTLGGFHMVDLNEEYLEGPTADFNMQGRETYWQASGEFFMYHCRRFKKWRIAALSAFNTNKNGNCMAFVSDGFPDRDILDPTLIKGWIEVSEGDWVRRPEAGVIDVGTLGQQMAGEDEDEDVEVEGVCTESEEEEAWSDATGAPSYEEPRQSKCPVKRVAKKAKEGAEAVARMAKKWVRRLFPNLLDAPNQEDEVPAEGEESELTDEVDADIACNVTTQEGCSYKQQFYIQQQRQHLPEKRGHELERLKRLQNVVMKEDKRAWLMTRIGLLQQLQVFWG